LDDARRIRADDVGGAVCVEVGDEGHEEAGHDFRPGLPNLLDVPGVECRRGCRHAGRGLAYVFLDPRRQLTIVVHAVEDPVSIGVGEVLVDPAVAVVVRAVADFVGTRMDLGVGVVAVGGVFYKADRGVAGGCRDGRVAPPVAVFVGVESAFDPFVHGSVAVVILAVADLHGAGVYGGVGVCAVAFFLAPTVFVGVRWNRGVLRGWGAARDQNRQPEQTRSHGPDVHHEGAVLMVFPPEHPPVAAAPSHQVVARLHLSYLGCSTPTGCLRHRRRPDHPRRRAGGRHVANKGHWRAIERLTDIGSGTGVIALRRGPEEWAGGDGSPG